MPVHRESISIPTRRRWKPVSGYRRNNSGGADHAMSRSSPLDPRVVGAQGNQTAWQDRSPMLGQLGDPAANNLFAHPRHFLWISLRRPILLRCALPCNFPRVKRFRHTNQGQSTGVAAPSSSSTELISAPQLFCNHRCGEAILPSTRDTWAQ